MLLFKSRLSAELKKVLDTINDAHGLDEEKVAQMLEYPPNPDMGDIALPCFKMSKSLRMSPVMISEKISQELEKLALCDIEKIETVNGYLNIYIKKDYFAKNVLENVLEKGEKYGSFDFGKGKTVVLDYSSPNVAKPFHIGHLGTTVIGHSLKKLHEFAGYSCVGVNHLGDWGTQFGKLIVAYNKWGDRKTIEEKGIDELVALYVKFHHEAEIDPELNEQARAEFTKLEHFDEENMKLWRWFIDISIEEYKKTYKQLDIEFDSYCGESFYSDKMPAVINELKEKNLLKIDDGASVVDLEEYKMPPCLILKRDGSSLYPARDISAAIYRKNTYDFEKVVYVTDAGQSLHFAQWFKVVELMGYEWAKNLVHVPYGKVSLNGEKLATRTGNVILLKDLFASAIEKVKAIMDDKNPNLENRDEKATAVGVGAIVFYYLSNNRIKDINFMLEDALCFDGNTGPYAQYTYARTCSVLDKAAGLDRSTSANYEINDKEKTLLRTISLFPEKVLQALNEYEPSVITRYILDVCTAFNGFYHDCQILGAEDEATKAFRLNLTEATRHVLGNAFTLICMKKTEKI
ncbi:MAG: arginine--tRNA ligase [Clostridia bacterium]|nr:arginine--tRNA ligase [Clostridia bacterium]